MEHQTDVEASKIRQQIWLFTHLCCRYGVISKRSMERLDWIQHNAIELLAKFAPQALICHRESLLLKLSERSIVRHLVEHWRSEQG